MNRTLIQRAKDAVRAWYEGARYRVGYPWIPATHQDARLDLPSATRQTLQSKARYFERNSPLINRLADIFETYTVGVGLTVHPQSSDGEWNKRARAWWSGWERLADISTRQTFGTLQGLIARAWFFDGECFILLTESETSRRPRLQVIESHRVKTPDKLISEEGKTVVDGVQIDTKTGRPVGYYIDGNEKPVPADIIIHVFEPSRPGQYRGIPFLTPAINLLSDLTEIEKLEIKAARAASVVANILKTSSGEVSAEELIANGGNVSTNSTTSEVSAYQERLGGETIVLRPDQELTQFKSDRPSVVAMDYMRQLRADVCSACGIPSVLAFPEQMQGTQYRGALDMAATFFKCRSAVMQEVVRRIWEYVIAAASPFERDINSKPSDWYKVTIPSPRAVNVDVGRNSAAMLAELQAGVTTYSQIYGPLGIHWEDAFNSLAEERQTAKDLGLIASGGGDVQVTALNGAQVASVLQVVTSVSSKTLAPEAAKQMLYIALPTTDRDIISSMVDEAASFEMPATPQPQTTPPPTQP